MPSFSVVVGWLRYTEATEASLIKYRTSMVTGSLASSPVAPAETDMLELRFPIPRCRDKVITCLSGRVGDHCMQQSEYFVQ